MDNCVVNDNLGLKNGGGLALYAPFTITGSFITENTTLDLNGPGGGIYAKVAGEGYISDSIIDINYAVERGAGMYVGVGTLLTVVRSSISGNRDAVMGGGAFIENADVLFSASSLLENRAEYGGGLYITSAGSAELVNVSVSNNIAGTEGGRGLQR